MAYAAGVQPPPIDPTLRLRSAFASTVLIAVCGGLGCHGVNGAATRGQTTTTPTPNANAAATTTPTPTPTANATANATATATATTTTATNKAATIGGDAAGMPRRRYKTAVVLLGTRDIAATESVRFQPIVCAIDGILTGGLACAQAMPATATARVTHGTPTTPRTVTLKRGQRGYKDENGERTYRAPLEPACCMYNTCVGETHAFLASPMVPLAAAVLAVWPADAEIDLVPRDGAIDQVSAAKALALPNVAPQLVVSQAFRAGGRSIVAATGRHGAALAIDDGSGAAWISAALTNARRLDVLATTDLDHDGNVEAIVYEAWANDFGLSVFGNRGATPIYRFNCGNI